VGVRDEEDPPAKKAPTTAAPTTAAPTTAAPTTTEAPTTAAATTAAGECTDNDAGVLEASGGVLADCASGKDAGFCDDTTFLGLCCAACQGAADEATLPPNCTDSDAGVKAATDGTVEDCEMGHAMGLCTDATFSDNCCETCGGHTGTTAAPCADDDEGVNLGTGGQLEDCRAAAEIGACVDAAFQQVCCLSCKTAKTETASVETTAAPELTTSEKDPALAAVAAATKVSDKYKQEAKIARAAAEASEEVATAAQEAATKAMQDNIDHENAMKESKETTTKTTTAYSVYEDVPSMLSGRQLVNKLMGK